MVKPLVIAVAPNGARLGRDQHSGVPLVKDEIVATALSCWEAGAAMIHLHVRDERGLHTIARSYYEPVLEAIDSHLGDKLVVQVTSEAAGVYRAAEQIEHVRSLKPRAVSLAVRELVPDEQAQDAAASLFADLDSWKCMSQYILYNPDDVARYIKLIEKGVIPRRKNFVLYVCGKYGTQAAELKELSRFVESDITSSLPMTCAFGPLNREILEQSVEFGVHLRVGFENNTQLLSGVPAKNNAEVVRDVAQLAEARGAALQNAEWLRQQHQELSRD